MIDKTIQSLEPRHWALWTICCLIIAFVHSFTLTIDRRVNQDEVQIIDLGRTVITPTTEWSLAWNVSLDAPVLPISYIGPAIQELAYRTTSPSIAGSRLMAIFSAILAATMLLGWLSKSTANPGLSILLAVVFLLDPLFADTYRQARIDGFAMAAVFFACWQLAVAKSRISAGRSCRTPVVIAGISFTASGFFWFSAPILGPLVVLELYRLLRVGLVKQVEVQEKLVSQIILWFMASCFMTLLILLLPISQHLDLYWQGIISNAAIQNRAAGTQTPIVQLFAVYSPVLFLSGLISVFFCRDWGLYLALLVAICMIQLTMIYPARVIYLLPYLVAIIGCAYSSAAGSQRKVKFRKYLGGMIAASLAFGALTVLLFRPMAALEQRPAREIAQVKELLEETIGRGPKKVLIEEWSAYYPARELGWKYYLVGSPLSRIAYSDFLTEMDYVIVRATPIVHFTTDQLAKELGFEELGVVEFRKSNPLNFSVGLTRFQFPAAGFPDIRIYRNPKSKG